MKAGITSPTVKRVMKAGITSPTVKREKGRYTLRYTSVINPEVHP